MKKVIEDKIALNDNSCVSDVTDEAPPGKPVVLNNLNLKKSALTCSVGQVHVSFSISNDLFLNFLLPSVITYTFCYCFDFVWLK